ncbi:MAG: efflux RND transporter permease subunit [Spirochaetaceae bacterium]|nr:efflux RND transporter permease subunit [Spirochaetaceae bacterium]
MMSIGSFSVKNPVLVNILMFALLAFGALSLSRMPREQFSEVPFYFVNIIVPWPGVSAEEVEKRLVIPIEEEMQGLDELDEISSVSGEGLAAVSVRFDDGISSDKFDKLFQDVRTRFSEVSLPEGTLDASVDSFSSNDFAPVIELVLSGDVGYPELVDAANLLEDPLRRIPDVAGVDLIGVRDRQIVLSTDRSALEARNIPLEELVRAVQARNVNVPGGTLTTERQDYLVRTVGELSDTAAFGDVVVRRNGEGTGTIRVRDVARILDEYDDSGQHSRFNGSTAVAMRITKVPNGGSVGVIEGVKEVMEEWGPKISRDITVSYLNDSSVPIQSSIDVLLNNALIGLALLVVILYFFLGLRNALMTALGIPVTFAIAFIVLDASGQTFNSNTLFGLVLVLGLIVDHAIVISENSFRLRQQGLDRRSAAINGTNQVAVPVIAATATTVAAFLPLMILPGTIGKFLRVIPLTVAIALLASTAEALVFLPSHYADWYEGKRRKGEGRKFLAFKRIYRRLVERLYRRRRLTVIVTLALMITSFMLVPFLNQDLFSAEDFSVFYIDITMPPGTPLEKTDFVTGRYEERIIPLVGNGEIAAVSTSVGFQAGDTGNNTNTSVAQILVDLSEAADGRTRSIATIMAEVQELTGDIPGPDSVLFRKAANGPPTDDPVSFRIFGDRYEEILVIADRLREELDADPDYLNIKDNFEPGTPLLTVRVNEERAASYGLSVASIGSFVRASVDGIEATTFFKDNKSIDVVVRFSDGAASEPSLLQQTMIPTPSGLAVPFTAVASLESGESVASIKRLDGRREVTVTAGAFNKDNIPEFNNRMQQIFDDEYADRFPGIEFSVGGEFAEFNDLLIQILRIFLIGIFLIYLILGTQFRSYSQPFLILFSVPLAFAGVVIYLAVSGTPFSTTVLYAAVALAGIAVNDAIVLISFINERRENGEAVGDSVLNAAETRLRPIILTSLTTIAGLTPTAIGLGGRSVVWSPMASTIIFGLIFSTLATLIFIPALYGSLFDRTWKKKKGEAVTDAV